jgi:hypothetical protein
MRFPLLFALSVSVLSAQLTTEQKIFDFNQLQALYAKNYGPYEWKRDAIGFDLLDSRPWLDRIGKTANDLDYYEVLIDYVSSLNDAHDVFTLPSNFSATLGFSTDIYDGKVLVDTINRTRLPRADYPIDIGDEVVSVDGRAANDLVTAFLKYAIAANPRSTSRIAAGLIPVRQQWIMPHAQDVGETAEVVVRKPNGDLQTSTIKWLKQYGPMANSGPVPDPRSNMKSSPRAAGSNSGDDGDATDPGVDPTSPVVPDVYPPYMDTLRKVQNAALMDRGQAVIGFGSRTPVFKLPANFVQRLGKVSSDFFYSGTFQSGGLTLGFIRIPSYSPPSSSLAISQFESEMVYFQANTDGLIVDEMRNPGGSVCFVENLLTRLIPYRFRVLGFEVRATRNWLLGFESNLVSAKSLGAEQWVINLYQSLYDSVNEAYTHNRGRTGAVPLCTPSLDRDPSVDRSGNMTAYSKPVMVLTDEMSASGGDAFAAAFQDNNRGLLFGMRTMGAGGSVVDWDATTYSEAFTRVTISIMNRKYPVVTPEYMTAPYVENIGVRPDVTVDYMTRDNLINSGAAFVGAFTQKMVEYVKSQRQ